MAKLTDISRRRFEKFLVQVGCTYQRTAGDHIIYVRPGLSRPIIVQADNEIPKFIIKSNLRTLGIETKEYLEIISTIK
jgi:predicted RNA binding protein YcfA (HicA-like mRNA interferase family)